MSKASKQQDKLINLQAQQLAAQVANWAATLDFQKQRFALLELPQFQQTLQLDVDKFAWQKAQETWERSYQEALLTGTYQGQPTKQWLIDQAKLTGSYNGERTLEGQLTDAQIQDMHDKMKLANDEFLSNTTGYFNGQKTFDREKFEAAQALDGWKFISTLSGPQNAFKQARAIATMPGGMSDLMGAFAGRYMLPSGAAVGAGGSGGVAGQLSDLMLGGGGNQAPTGPTAPGAAAPITPPGAGTTPPAGPPYQAIPGRGFTPDQWNQPTRDAVAAWNAAHPGMVADGSQVGYHVVGPVAPGPALAGAANAAFGSTYSPPGVQAPVGAYNYSGTPNGSVAVYPPGVVSPPATADVSTQQPINPLSVSQAVNQPYQYAGPTTPGTTSDTLPLPNQMDARNYSNAYQYQRDLVWAGYENAQWDKGLAQEAFLKSLPTYGGPAKGAIAF
jgi:hypothetical protein